MPQSTNLLIITPDISENSLGRAYCLWLLARSAKFTVKVVAIQGSHIWQPLAESSFAADCDRISRKDLPKFVEWSSVIIAVKPLPSSFGTILRYSRGKRPLLLDIDDPDLEVWDPHFVHLSRLFLRFLRHPHYLARMTKIRKNIDLADQIIVSNPVLQERYGGIVIPHVRKSHTPGKPHLSATPSVGFVGTARKHKGIDSLRAAIESLQQEGFTLIVTDDAPSDAHPWETWKGAVSMEEGIDIVSECDIVAIPSRDTVFSEAQLPAKLIDAMLLGRAIVASALGPIRWALGDTGILIEPGNTKQLISAFRQLVDPGIRRDLGSSAYVRAATMFSIESNTCAFRRAVEAATSQFQRCNSGKF